MKPVRTDPGPASRGDQDRSALRVSLPVFSALPLELLAQSSLALSIARSDLPPPEGSSLALLLPPQGIDLEGEEALQLLSEASQLGGIPLVAFGLLSLLTSLSPIAQEEVEHTRHQAPALAILPAFRFAPLCELLLQSLQALLVLLTPERLGLLPLSGVVGPGEGRR